MSFEFTAAGVKFLNTVTYKSILFINSINKIMKNVIHEKE